MAEQEQYNNRTLCMPSVARLHSTGLCPPTPQAAMIQNSSGLATTAQAVALVWRATVLGLGSCQTFKMRLWARGGEAGRLSVTSPLHPLPMTLATDSSVLVTVSARAHVHACLAKGSAHAIVGSVWSGKMKALPCPGLVPAEP